MTFDPYENPGLTHVLFQMAMAKHTGQQITIAAGMGVPPQLLSFSDSDLTGYLRQLQIARANPISTWRGLDVRHLKHYTSEYRQIDVLAALAPAMPLSQTILDFLTLRDIPHASLDCILTGAAMPVFNGDIETNVTRFFSTDTEDIRLAMAFRKQMVQEAEPHRHNVPTGIYVLQREPLPRLDELIEYQEIRLYISPRGICGAIIFDPPPDTYDLAIASHKDGHLSLPAFIPFCWMPEDDTNTVQVFVPSAVHFALEILFASIWRDACIVQEKALQERRDRGKAYKASKRYTPHENPLRLPRTVYRSQWATDADRQITEAISRSAHAVRGHYRRLADDHTASETAAETAQEYGYPAPPDGYTFVRPHTRGSGDLQSQTRRVICKGLQVARTLLS